MTTLSDVYHIRLGDRRTHIVVFFGRLGSREQTVEVGDDIGILLHLRNILLGKDDEFVEQLSLQRENLILSTQNFLFIFLQLLRDIALCLSQRLLTHPLLWYLVLIRVAHLQIIAEDVIVAYLQ